MTMTIALAGKGGTGKTTLAALLLRYLAREFPEKATLAVDADPNANLNEVLGLEVIDTIGTILEDTKKPGAVPPGMAKEIFVEYRLARALVETKHYDLLVMGNPQGPGCYCYPNDLLRRYLEKLGANYDFIVTDNEAGLEHLSRRVLPEVDLMLVTSDATARGVRSAGRVRGIIEGVKINVNRIGLVIVRAREGAQAGLDQEIEKTGLDLYGTIPFDHKIADLDLHGHPLLDLPLDAPAAVAAESLFQRYLFPGA